MKASTIRRVKSGREYDQLFPEANGQDETIKRNASLDDTLALIPRVVIDTLDHTKGISQVLKGRTTFDTCRNIWQFVYDHIAYSPDSDGYEQIRNPARIWRDRFKGVDCDCYSTFISSILTNLKIPHKLRITKYKRDFQHIYPIVPTRNGHITLDCVTDHFDYEVPYSDKKDINMDLQYLSGLQGADDRGSDYVFDGYEDEIGALGAKGPKKKKKGFFKKLISKINKINPATILLRNGFLAAMKLNLFKVASRIKYAYLSPEDAAKRGIIPDKYQRLVKVREKLENMFETAGGNPKNLKKAILKGKGNKNKEVALSGIGFLPSDMSVMYMDSNTPLQQLLGPEIYFSENVEGMEGLGQLGEPATGAAIAAASAAVAAIAKILKSIGNIFGGKEKGSEDFAEGATAAADKEIAESPTASKSAASAAPAYTEAELPAAPAITTQNDSSNQSGASEAMSEETGVPATTMATPSDTASVIPVVNSTSSPPPSGESFWTKNKKWLLPAAIGAGGIAIVAIGLKMVNRKSPSVHGLNGLPRRKKKGGKKSKKHKNSKKQPVALL